MGHEQQTTKLVTARWMLGTGATKVRGQIDLAFWAFFNLQLTAPAEWGRASFNEEKI
jgi:hypothetical protein